MDIARLPSTALAYPRPAGEVRNPRADVPGRAVAPVRRQSAPSEYVVQGELLQRERRYAQSTQAFLDGRQGAGGGSQQGSGNRQAVNAYQDNARLGVSSASPQGRAVDYFA